jgi:signal transduction histidine kinase
MTGSVPDDASGDAVEPTRVLIVDDDENNLLALKTVVEDVVEVVTASSGEEALRQLLRHDFAAILLDVFMPVMDGYETARLIRQRELSKGTPIIFLSAVNKEFEHLNRGYAMGAVDYVFKPVEPLILRSKVAVFVELHDKKRALERGVIEERRLREANQAAHRETLRAEQALRQAEEELAQAKKMDAVGKLTGGIAHDFNNLLAAVLGGLDLVQRQIVLNDRQQEIVDLTMRSARQGAELIKRLLAFSRRQDLNAAPIPCERLATSLNGILATTLGGLVQIEWHVAEGVWEVMADENQLELAMMNLMLNARDAMPEGGRIQVFFDNRTVADVHGPAGPGEYVSIRVEDTGAGIAAEDLDLVFEPFFTTKGVGEGTGLGLSMVYGFVKQSGGSVEVRSEPGVGTSFELLLPRAADKQAPATIPNQMSSHSGRASSILLVDDHFAVRATTEAMLQQLGHAVTSVGDGPSALALIEAAPQRFDLIIADYAMPGMSGIELLRNARTHSPHVPAIVVTGYAEAEKLSDGPEDVLIVRKPFTAEILNAAIARASHNEAVAA